METSSKRARGSARGRAARALIAIWLVRLGLTDGKPRSPACTATAVGDSARP